MNNDRYLFRGICKETKKWVWGHLITDANERVYIAKEFSFEQRIAYDPEFHGYESLDAALVIPETVGQWIGLTDENGVKIFEGDIVQYEKSNAIVEWYEAEFIAMCRNETHTAYDCAGNLLIGGLCVVAGSIHDHLLGEKQ